MNTVKSRTALFLLDDKTGVENDATALTDLGWTLIATQGTYRHLIAAGIPAERLQSVDVVTGMEPLLGHRVVTLHPTIHGGLLARPTDHDDWVAKGFPYIDLVYVGLYPLEQAIQAFADGKASLDDVLEKTDIGGPAILRAAAKGRRYIATQPSEMRKMLTWLQEGELNPGHFRLSCACRAERVAEHYARISADHLEATLQAMVLSGTLWETPERAAS
ncbi:MAG: bifunctional phosphoribosylaminoimidazolecarboxamide formyltransferase/inosine monophosphate [Candidatus Parcubacteria bacterium]|jgi:phosphoribosylaminoimidazolecarboxamide formyltransferase/IMP cyclohydrolase